jgi:hypothetical protein
MLTTLPPSCAVVMKSGNLNFLEPSGPLQACNGTALPLLLPPSCAVVMKSENLNFLEPSGLHQACNGTVLPFDGRHSVDVVWWSQQSLPSFILRYTDTCKECSACLAMVCKCACGPVPAIAYLAPNTAQGVLTYCIPPMYCIYLF